MTYSKYKIYNEFFLIPKFTSKNNDKQIAVFKDTKYYLKIINDIYSKLGSINKTVKEYE